MDLERRKFIAGAGAAATLPFLSSCSRGGDEVRRPAGVPVGPFGDDSTAEQVTSGVDLRGKTALVTGATSGLGLETMRVLALRGAHVIGTGRTLEKAKAACESVAGRTTPIALELERWETIVSATDLIKALGMPIDMLICNAGIMALPQLEQAYGLEKQFVVNQLGHFILTNRLLPQVQAAPQGRIVVVSSLGYQWAPPSGIEFDNLEGSRDYEPNKMYGQSKLANGLFSLELSRRLRESGSLATSNSVLRTRKWQDKSGNDRYTTEIVANEMQMLGSGRGMGGEGRAPGGRASGGEPDGDPGRSSTEKDDFDDDIPF